MIKKNLSIFIISLALAVNFSASYAENLLATAEQAGSFKIFLGAIKAAGLTQQLDEMGPYTIFAPDDHAFSALAEGEWELISKNKIRLIRLLNYHIIKGKVKITEVKPGTIASLEGNLLRLKSDNGLVTVNGASVTQSDLIADNGVIHAIDDVLMPPD
jgi:uncharacterized surface protein with fasciclin (FAS1) repeats